MGPKALAVLADAPAFAFEPAPGRGLPQNALWHVGGAVFRGVEARKIFPENFPLGIALDALGARIPARNPAIGIDHVDRVVGHALDEETKPLVGLDVLAQRIGLTHSRAPATTTRRNACTGGWFRTWQPRINCAVRALVWMDLPRFGGQFRFWRQVVSRVNWSSCEGVFFCSAPGGAILPSRPA